VFKDKTCEVFDSTGIKLMSIKMKGKSFSTNIQTDLAYSSAAKVGNWEKTKTIENSEKKKIMEIKEASLKWEQKLKAAAKDRKLKIAKLRKKSVSNNDSDDESRKTSKRSHRKHMKHSHYDTGDHEKRKEKGSKRKKKEWSLEPSDFSRDDLESSFEEDRRRKKKQSKRLRDRGSRSDSNYCDEGLVQKRNHGKHNKCHQRSESSEDWSLHQKKQGRVLENCVL